jgi:O-antigen/teichoic acid export membrane protein
MSASTPPPASSSPRSVRAADGSDWRRREIRLAATNAIKLGSSLLATWGIALVARLFIPRFLGPDRFGILNFADAFTATAFVVLGLGLDTYVRKEISVRPAHASDFVGGIVALRMIMLVLVYGGMEIILRYTGRSAEVRMLVYIMGAAQFFIVGSTTSAGLLQATGQVTEMSVLSVVTKVVWAVGIALAIWLKLGLWAFAAAMAASEGLKAMVLFALARKHVGFALTIDARATGAVILASLPFYISGLATTIYDKIGVSLLAFMGSDREVGWYGAAAGLAGLTLLLAPLISWVLIPLFARAAAASAAELSLMVRRSLEFILTMTIPVSLMMCVGADIWIKILFGANFAPAAMALRVLAVANLMMYVSIVCAYALAVSNLPWRMSAVFASGMLVNPVCNLLLIKPCLALGLGGGGAACATATLVTEIGVVTSLLTMLGRRVLNARLVSRAVKNLAVAGGVVALDALVLRPWGWVRLPLEAAIYLVLVLAIKAVDIRELASSIRMVIQQRRNKSSAPPPSAT